MSDAYDDEDDGTELTSYVEFEADGVLIDVAAMQEPEDDHEGVTA